MYYWVLLYVHDLAYVVCVVFSSLISSRSTCQSFPQQTGTASITPTQRPVMNTCTSWIHKRQWQLLNRRSANMWIGNHHVTASRLWRTVSLRCVCTALLAGVPLLSFYFSLWPSGFSPASFYWGICSMFNSICTPIYWFWLFKLCFLCFQLLNLWAEPWDTSPQLWQSVTLDVCHVHFITLHQEGLKVL